MTRPTASVTATSSSFRHPPGGGERGHAHAVPEEQDDVLGDVGVLGDPQRRPQLILRQGIPVALVWERRGGVTSAILAWRLIKKSCYLY